MKATSSFIILMLTISIPGCLQKTTDKETSNKETEKDKVTEVVDRAITWAGGLDKWNTIDSLTYIKRSRLLYENQEVEYDITQSHAYVLNPSLTMNIEWTTDAGINNIFHSDSTSIKQLNDSIIDQGTKVMESAMSAFYVLGMPYKLKDPGTILSYEGQKSFGDKTADVVRASYSPDEYDNHSTSDLWWYYFDVVDGAFLGCMVYHPPTYALIENIAFHDVNGMKFQKRRMSYRCDSLGNKQYLRAEFWYDDFEVSFLQ